MNSVRSTESTEKLNVEGNGDRKTELQKAGIKRLSCIHNFIWSKGIAKSAKSVKKNTFTNNGIPGSVVLFNIHINAYVLFS